MKSLVFALLLATSLLPFAHAADHPSAPPSPGEDETDPPRAFPYGPAAPACATDGKDISMDSDAIVAAIKGAQFCWQAVVLVNNCASDDAGDLPFADAATPKCLAEFDQHKPAAKDRALLATLTSACDAKWKGRSGSHYASQNARCKLDALLWMDNLTSEN